MDPEDARLQEVEEEASPQHELRRGHTTASGHSMQRMATATTTSSAMSGAAAAPRESALSRLSTRSDLERDPTTISRIQTARSQHSATVGRSLKSRESRKPLPSFGAGKPYPPPLPDQEEYVVEFDGPDDPLHAQNWPLRKKILTGAMLGYTTFIASFTSAIFANVTPFVAKEYHVSAEVGLLGISLYVLGFASGPLLWAPFSELYGRRLPLIISMFGFSIFEIAVATGENLQTILICRFFGGFFGACPLAVVAAVFSDMFDNHTRGIAITVFSMMVFVGPNLAPFIGGFICTSYLGWRWTEYLTGILGFASFGLNLIFLEETYPPTILEAKASELRRRTKNWGIHARQSEIEIDFHELVSKNLSRPLRILFTEPIVFLISVYMAFIYGLLYLFLTAYDLVFQGVHEMSPGVGGLPYFGMIVGMILSGCYILLTQPAYNRKLAANNNVTIPEWRLPPVIIGGASFAIGLFWFGWTGYKKDIPWIVPTLSGLATGFGIMAIFLQLLNYLVDAYLMFAASAIAANTFLRSLCGAVFPLFATYMFNGMGIQWALTFLGALATVMIPIPVIFYVYGKRIRGRSAYAPTTPFVPNNDDEAETPEANGGEKTTAADGDHSV